MQKIWKFEQFQECNFKDKDVGIYQELIDILEKEKRGVKYIFKESLININKDKQEKYKKLAFEFEKINEINYNDINNEFNLYYNFFVNKIISYLYDGKEKNQVIKTMKNIYDESKGVLKMGEEGKTLYNYLLNNNLYEK